MADSQSQIDITPYKVRRENVITNQQKTYEAKPNSDLASSILEKLTEIKGNLYPTHLNIPPQKFGQSLPTTPGAYTLHSPEMPSNPDRPISNFESFPRNETFGDLLHGSKSTEISPTTKLKSSLLYDSSAANPRFQSISESFPLSNLEFSRTNPENLNIYKDTSTPAFTNQAIAQELTPSNMMKASNQFSSIPHFSSQASAEFASFTPTAEQTYKNQLKETRQSSEERQKSQVSVEPAKTRSQILEEKKAALRKKQEEIIASQTSLDLAARVNQREILSPKEDKSVSSVASRNQITEGKGSGGPKSRAQLISALEQAIKTGQVGSSKNDVDSVSDVQQKSEQQLEALKKPTALKKTGERDTEKAKPKTSATKTSSSNVNKEYTGGHSTTHEGMSIDADMSSSQQRRTTDTHENLMNVAKTQKAVANKRSENRETNPERGESKYTSSAQNQVEREMIPSFREAIKNQGILNSGNSSPSHEQLTEFTFTHQITGSDSSRQERRDSPVKKSKRESPMKKERPDNVVKKSLNELSSENSRQNSSPPKKDAVLDKSGASANDDQAVHQGEKKKTSKILDKQTPPKKKQTTQQDDKSSVGSYVTIEHEKPERTRTSKNTSISLPKQDQGEPSSTQQIPSRTFSNTPPKRDVREDASIERVNTAGPVQHSPQARKVVDQVQTNASQQQHNMNSSPQQLDQAQLQMLKSQNGPVFHSPAQAKKENQMQMPMNQAQNQNVQMFGSPQQMGNMNPMQMQQMQQMQQVQMPQGFQSPLGLQSPPRMNNNPMQMQMNSGNMQYQMPQMPMFVSPPMPNFGEFGAAEYQKYILMIMNYYETHMGHMKGIIAKQNEAFIHERQKNQILEQRNIELTKRIQNLENTVKNRPDNDATQKELKTRYEVVMDELTALKRTMLAKQVNSQTEIAAPAPVVVQRPQEESKEYSNLLYQEILSLRKDLENQRETMYDFKSSTRHLEGQIKDLEKMYIEELKNNAQVSNKREELQDALERYKTDYIKMDTLNKIILDGYEKTRKDLETMKNANAQAAEERYEPSEVVHHSADQTQQTTPYNNERGRHVSMGSVHVHEEKDRPRREIFIRSISPQRFDTEENNQEMLRNKHKAMDSQVKGLMNWSGNQPQMTYPHTYTQSAGYGSSNYESMNQNYGQNAYYNNQQSSKQNLNVPPQTAEKPKTVVSTGGRGGTRSHIVFPSFQRIEDNKDEINRVEQRLVQLQQHRKIIENEIFKMPSVTKTLDQKKKKMGLDMELESIDNEIEDCKNVLRQYDVLNVK